ncbi:efflux RND transporter permease subunit [Clostridium sp. BJN0001]|uniref:efflux RND transporter permease subunit n=1 Tax=Clostridium sp. BJN0001 TaxID=2930219 RepID=UPI001FD524BB|nr:efflux RND transporter permease subunit [Clostridium sp. BJN0001]
MNLTRTSVKRPLTIIMVFLVLLLFGGIGYSKMAVDLMPDMDLPFLMVTTQWNGAGPEDVDEQISKKLEKQLSGISKIKDTMSYSYEGFSMVGLEFEYGVDIDEVMNDVRSKVDMVQAQLPDDVEKSSIMKADMNDMPVGQLVISGDNKTGDAIANFADDNVQKQMESIDGVTSAESNGGDKSQIDITADPSVINSYGVSISEISGVLSGTNKTYPYGSITEGENKIVLRATEELNSLEDVKNIQIPTASGKTVSLDSLCNVELTKADQTGIYRYNGQQSLIMDVSKQRDANTVKVMREVKKKVEEINKSNPDYTIKIINDTSDFINQSMKSIFKNLIESAIISFIVIFAFLKSVRASLVVSVAIPTSIVGAVALLYFSNESLNMVTTGSLVIAIGMVVDNATVVIENIFKYRSKGDMLIEDCAIEGTRTVTNAVIASTLTTVAIFLPILFTEGLAEIMFGSLAKTLIFALTISLIVSLTLVPSIFNKLSGKGSQNKLVEKPSPIFDKVKQKYKKLLDVSLNHKKLVVIISIALFAASIFGSTFIGMDFMANSDEGQISVSIKLPKGLALKPSDEYIMMAEEKLSDIDEIKTVVTTYETSGIKTGSNASINIQLVPKAERKRSTKDIQKEIEDRMNKVPDCKITTSMASSIMQSSPGSTSSGITLQFQGQDMDVLTSLSEDIKEKLETVDGLKNVETSVSDTDKEARFIIDKKKASDYGINTATIATLLRTSINGSNVTQAKINDYDIDVNLKVQDKSIDSIDDIKNMKVLSNTGQEVPISAFADISMENGLKTIQKFDGDYVVDITADVDGIDTSKASKLAKAKAAEVELPRNYKISDGGVTQMMNESMSGLVLSMIIAIILVYMVMVAQFESFSKPFIIMFSIPFGFVGVVAALLLTRVTLSIVGMLGSILLVGIVVNNGIVLIDYIEQLRKTNINKDLKEVVSYGASQRLRPVLMTTATTVLGMIPTALAFGEGGETMQPLAIVIIGGLSVSTLVTLILIPSIYMIFDKLENKFNQKFGRCINKIKSKFNRFTNDKIKSKIGSIKSKSIDRKNKKNINK